MTAADASSENGAGDAPPRVATVRIERGTPSVPPPPDSGEADAIGRVLGGRYVLESVHARGGMGIIYRARHLAVGRAVAVKILRADLARNTEALLRFHREAQAAAAIGHPHIVEVLDFGHGADGGAYLVMELVEGESLAALLRREGPLGVPRALKIARQVADALAAAHAKGIVHRDLKGENVMVRGDAGGDFVKVLDFGISKVMEDDAGHAPITRDGAVLGTPQYMAPEQGSDGGLVDHRADLYALGCILFELLTGSLPYEGKTPVEVLYKHNHAPIPKPSARAPQAHVPSSVDALVTRLLAKAREDRPADAHAVVAALDAALAPDAGVARWRRRVAVAALVTLGSLVTEAAWRSPRHPPARPVVVVPSVEAPHAPPTPARIDSPRLPLVETSPTPTTAAPSQPSPTTVPVGALRERSPNGIGVPRRVLHPVRRARVPERDYPADLRDDPY